MGVASGCVPWSDWTQHVSIVSAPPLYSKILSHGPSRVRSMSGSVPLGSSALTSEMSVGHYTVQMAYVCIWKITGFPEWKQCITSMPHPFQFAKNLPSGPSRRSILLQIGFQWLLISGEVDRSLSWCWHLTYKSQCKSADFYFSFALIQLCNTMVTHFQHLLHVCPDFVHHGLRNSLEPLFKGFVVNNSDLMLC